MELLYLYKEKGRTDRGSNLDGAATYSASVQTDPEADEQWEPGVFPGEKSGRGLALTNHSI